MIRFNWFLLVLLVWHIIYKKNQVRGEFRAKSTCRTSTSIMTLCHYLQIMEDLIDPSQLSMYKC